MEWLSVRRRADLPQHGHSILEAGLELVGDLRAEIPHLVQLTSMYLIILISDRPKFPINLQVSSGGAWRSVAALISLPRSSRLFA